MTVVSDILRFSLIALWVVPAAALICIALFALAVPGLALGSIYTRFVLKLRRTKVPEIVESLTCSIDADCPEGQICVNGTCVPTQN